MACHFHFTVLAPLGLVGVEKRLEESALGLFVYHSHFNHKNILKSRTERIDLDMETSTSDVMQGSGTMFCTHDEAIKLTRALSQVFASAGYPHQIGVDDEHGKNTVWTNHDWPLT